MENIEDPAVAASAEQMQKLKEKIEDVEMVEFLRSGVSKRVERVASWTCSNGELRIFEEPEEPDVMDMDVNVPLVRDAFSLQLAGDNSQLTQDQKARGDPGATKRMINRLRDIVATQEHIELDSQCAICMDDITVGDILHTLPACQHFFHKDCAAEWLKKRWTCAVCRQPLRFCRVAKSRLEQKIAPQTTAASSRAMPQKKSLNKRRGRYARTSAMKKRDKLAKSNISDPSKTTEESITSDTITTSDSNSSCSYDVPARVCIMAYVYRDVTQKALPSMAATSPPVFLPLISSKTKEQYGMITRFSRSTTLEIVRFVFDVPATARFCGVHVKLPASAALVVVKVNAPAFLLGLNIATTVEKENTSASADLATMLTHNRGQNISIIVVVPAYPDVVESDRPTQEIAGDRNNAPDVVDCIVDTTTEDVPSSIIFQQHYNEAKAFLYLD